MSSAEPIRILYLSSINGGHDFRFVEKFRTLEPHYKFLFVTMDADLEREIRPYGIECRNLNPQKRAFDDWDRRGAYGPIDRLRLRWGFRRHRQAFRQLLAEFRPHIVHAGWLQTDSYLAACEKCTPLVVMEWGTDILIRPFDNERNLAKTRFTLSQADLFVCDAQDSADKCNLILGKKRIPILQFPWGIDLKRFHANGRATELGSPLRIAVVKNLVEVSDLPTLLKALVILKRQKVALQVDFYGAGALRANLEAEAKALGVDGIARFHGRVDYAKIPELLRRADLYVSCNLSEGTSLAMMEAMACGALPIVTRLPAYEQWITDGLNGYLFPVKDAPALAKVIGAVAGAAERGEAAQLESMRRYNLELSAREFNWDDNFAKLVRGYEGLLKTRSEKR